MVKMNHAILKLITTHPNWITIVPGLAYVEIEIDSRTRIDFSKFDVTNFRVIICAVGNNAGAGKGIEVWDATTGQQLCEVIWNGAANQRGLAGSWSKTNIPTVDSLIQSRIKGAAVGESFNVFSVDLEYQYV